MAMLILLVLLIFFAALGVPLAFAIGASCVSYILIYAPNFITMLPQRVWNGAYSEPMIAMPLFMLAGELMNTGGITQRIINFCMELLRPVRGGLGEVNIVASMIFGGISGSSVADTSALGSILIPAMEKEGYPPEASAGITVASSTMGMIIPPSPPMIVYSMISGASVGALFMAGAVPGILIGLFMMAYAVIFCITKGEDKQRIRAKMSELRGNGFLKLFADSFFALLCPIIVLGGIYSGIVTPTEAACVSVFYALFVSLVVYRSISLKDLIPFLASSVKTYGGLAFVLAFATAFGRVLSLTRATKVIEDFIVGNFTTSWSVLSVLVILFLILGMVMDTGPAIVILAPILLPAVQALGVDSVHFGVILVCCLSIGLATPPFGLDLFVAGNLAEEPPMAVAKRAVPFIISFLLALALITYVEPVSLALLGR